MTAVASTGVAGQRRAIPWPLVSIALAIALWEVIGDTGIAGAGTVPSFHAVVQQLWADRSLYPANIGATVKEAAIGFVIGNALAIGLSIAFVLFAPAERALTGLMVVLFAMPPIVAAPVLAVAFNADTAKVMLAALMVIFPTLINTLLGLRSLDQATIDVIDVYGGTRLTVLRRARLRAALPSMMVGLQIAAPAALLGAILGEFLGGDSGLGVFMLNSLAQFNAARTWGAGLIATLLASVIFFAFMVIARRLAAANASPTVGLGSPPPASHATRLSRYASATGWFLVSAGVVFLAWYAFVDGLGLDPLFAKTPDAVFKTLTSGPNAHRIWSELGQTVPYALAGLLCGLLAAVLGAIAFVMFPSFERATLPIALVLQSVPLVAMAPVLITVFGRGSAVMIIVSTIVTFFPALVTVATGLRSVPAAALDVLDVYGASKVTTMWRVRIPYAVPSLLAAAQLVAPLALLGVMIAQWLATGTGLGGDIENARFQLEFDVVWAEAAVATAFAVLAYALIGLAEKAASKRFGATGGSR